jgi:hypothetical protein
MAKFRRWLNMEPLSPEAQALEDARIEAILDDLPEVSVTITAHFVKDVCYRVGGCGDNCPVWVREGTDARGPN